VLAASQAVADELTAMGIAPHRVVVRHLPRAELGLVSGDRAAFREALGYSPTDIVITTVGRAVPVKGWDVLLNAFQKVSSKLPAAHLLLLGSTDSPHERQWFSEMNAFVQKHGLTEKVQFTGHINKELPNYLNAADLFVLPSRSEACSFALLEAVEMGLPCVATRVGAAEQTIRDGTNGFLIPRNDVGELAAKLAMLVKNDALRAQFARAARVPEGFPHLEEFGEQLCRFYTSFLPNTDLPLKGASKKTA
jgi:glycosyltransferase involved in cell wall biosynthesis